MVTVLVVEDDADIREFVTEIVRDHLRDLGLAVRIDVAEHGADGLRKMKQQHYDLILTDLKMPKMSGVQMLKRKAVEEGLSKDSPVVVVTGNREDPEFGSFHDLEILEKPIVLSQLYQVLNRHLYMSKH